MTRCERLGVLETSLLLLDEPGTPFAFVACIELDGDPLRDEDGRIRLDDLRTMADGTLRAHPRLRQIPRRVPLGLGRPVWVDAPAFDVRDHLSAETLPETSPTALGERIVTYMKAPFEPGRPLWRILMVGGLPDGRVAMLVKVHHCAMDGVGGLGAFASMLSLDAELPALAPPAPWTASPAPRSTALVLAALADHLAYARFLGRLTVRALRAPREAWRRARSMVESFRRDAAVGAESLGVMQPAGPRRQVAHVTLPLADVAAVRSAFGVTFNDVMIGLAAGSLRQLLEDRGSLAPGAELVVASPVSTRRSDDTGLGNQFAMMSVRVALDDTQPASRLRTVGAITSEIKVRRSAQDTERLIELLGFMVPALLRRPVRRAERQGTPLSVSSVVGPPVPVWFMGARLRSFFGLAPMPPFGGIRVVCVSVEDTVEMGITGDPDAVPDLQRFADGLHTELRLLREAAS